MKVLSLWQPWASLMARRFKTIETRTWPCPFNGELFIHAAKGGLKSGERRELEAHPRWRKALQALGVQEINDLPRGAVLCRLDVVEVSPTDQLVDMRVDDDELLFGNFDPGRFAWFTKNVRRFYPVEVTGRQGIFTPSKDEQRRIIGALRDAR